MLRAFADAKSVRSAAAVKALLALLLVVAAGLLAAVSFAAPATVRYAHFSSVNSPAGGGPLVLASETPRVFTISVNGTADPETGSDLLRTLSDPSSGAGLSVEIDEGGRVAVSAPGPVVGGPPSVLVSESPTVVTYRSSGSSARLSVDSAAGSSVVPAGRIAFYGVYTDPEASIDWELDTAATGSSPTLVGAMAWTGAAMCLLATLALALVHLPRVQVGGRPSLLVLGAVAAFWVAMGLLMRANFDDGWILAQTRMYNPYGWFSMYWENASLPAPTGYLWEWMVSRVALIVDYQYAVTRLVVTGSAWFIGWFLIDRSLRLQGSAPGARIAAFAAFAAVGAGIGMNVRPEAFTAMLAAAVLLVATLPASSAGWRGITVAILGGVAVGSHPAGWTVALPAAAVVVQDLRCVMGWRTRGLVLATSLAAALATLAVFVSLDLPAAISLPAVEFLSSGPLQGKSPLDEFARMTDLVGFPPNFRMGMAVCLLAIAFLLGWLLKPGGEPGGFLAACAALSMAGLMLTSSKWAAHTAALAPAVGVTAGLVWPELSRSPKRVLGVGAAVVFMVAWAFTGDTSLGSPYPGNQSMLPGDQLFTTPKTALWLALAMTTAGLVAALVLIRPALRGGAVAAGLAAWFLLIPSLGVAAASAAELVRGRDGWNLTAQNLRPGSDCGAADTMPVFMLSPGVLPNPEAVPMLSVASGSELAVRSAEVAGLAAVWTDARADEEVTLELVGTAGGPIPLVRHPPRDADYALWTAPLGIALDSATIRVTSSDGEASLVSEPFVGMGGFWEDGAAAVDVLAAPYTFLQIPCTGPQALPLDTVTESTPIVWAGEVTQAPSWWLPVRLASASEVFALSMGDGPVGLGLSMMRPTELAKLAEQRTCTSGWGSMDLGSCQPEGPEQRDPSGAP